MGFRAQRPFVAPPRRPGSAACPVAASRGTSPVVDNDLADRGKVLDTSCVAEAGDRHRDCPFCQEPRPSGRTLHTWVTSPRRSPWNLGEEVLSGRVGRHAFSFSCWSGWSKGSATPLRVAPLVSG